MSTKSNRSSGTQHTQRGVNQGNVLVGPQSGLPFDEVVDSNGKRRLAVDANFVAQNVQANVNLDSDEDEVAVEDPDTGAHIRVEEDGSINTNTEVDAADGDNIAVSSHPAQVFSENPDTITTSGFEEIFSYTSSDNRTRIVQIDCTVSTPSRIRVKLNGSIIKELWSSPLERNVRFKFGEHRPLTSGQTVTIEAQVERFIHSSYDTFTSLEGYLR